MECESGSCQHAKQLWCVCECGGAQHGTAPLKWAAFLRAYGDPETAHAQAEKDQYHKILEWQTPSQLDLQERIKIHSKYNRSKLMQADHVGVLSYVRLNTITDYLKKDKQANKELLSIVDIIDKARARAVASDPNFSGRLGDHFWCDLTVALVQVLQALTTIPGLTATPAIPLDPTERAWKHMRAVARDLPSDEMIASFTEPGISSSDWSTVIAWFPRAVWMQLKENRSQSWGIDPTCSRVGSDSSRAARDGLAMLQAMESIVLDAVLEIMAVFLARYFAKSLTLPLQTVIFKLQILTLLLCPDPYAHEDVWNSCVVPLVGGQKLIRGSSNSPQPNGADKLLALFVKTVLYRRR